MGKFVHIKCICLFAPLQNFFLITTVIHTISIFYFHSKIQKKTALFDVVIKDITELFTSSLIINFPNRFSLLCKKRWLLHT